MLVLYALRQNRIKGIDPVFRMVQTRRSIAINDVDAVNTSPTKRVKLSIDSGTPEIIIYSCSKFIINVMQDVSSNSRNALTPQSKASDETSLRHRVDSPWKVGAHVSSAGGVENAVTNAATIG